MNYPCTTFDRVLSLFAGVYPVYRANYLLLTEDERYKARLFELTGSVGYSDLEVMDDCEHYRTTEQQIIGAGNPSVNGHVANRHLSAAYTYLSNVQRIMLHRHSTPLSKTTSVRCPMIASPARINLSGCATRLILNTPSDSQGPSGIDSARKWGVCYSYAHVLGKRVVPSVSQHEVQELSSAVLQCVSAMNIIRILVKELRIPEFIYTPRH